MTLFVGIDPGLSGGVVLLRNDGSLYAAHPMPQTAGRISGYALALMLRDVQHNLSGVAIEEVHTMPGMGVVGAFTFGRSVGVIEGAASALGVSVEFVRPQRWQRDLGLPKRPAADKTDKKAVARSKADHKEMLRSKAMEMIPELTPRVQRKKDSGIADATLIALWLLRSRTRAPEALTVSGLSPET